jgi:hypothetical protein
MDLRPAPEPWLEEDDADGNSEFSCHCCWARQVCSHSSYVASSQDDTREAAADRCSLWRIEVEAALRFYHRLAYTDPMQVRRFFEDSSRAHGLELVRRDNLGHLRMPF